VANLELLGDQDVPADCNLLIIAAPTQALAPSELEKIDRYLAQADACSSCLITIPSAIPRAGADYAKVGH